MPDYMYRKSVMMCATKLELNYSNSVSEISNDDQYHHLLNFYAEQKPSNPGFLNP